MRLAGLADRARLAADLLLAMARRGMLGTGPETLLAVVDLWLFVEESTLEAKPKQEQGTPAQTPKPKPRWKLLTKATRWDLLVGSLVCVRRDDGREVITTVYWPPGTVPVAGERGEKRRGVVWLYDVGCVDLSQVIAVWVGGGGPVVGPVSTREVA